MKTALLALVARFGAWLWDIVMDLARHEVASKNAVQEVQDDIRLADQAEALRVERAAAAVPRELPEPPATDTPAARIETRRGRRASSP